MMVAHFARGSRTAESQAALEYTILTAVIGTPEARPGATGQGLENKAKSHPNSKQARIPLKVGDLGENA